MLIRNQRAFAAGVVFLVFAGFYFVVSLNYAAGTAARMGPGFFPRMLSIIFGLLALGVIFGAMSPRAHRQSLEHWDIKGLLWITGSVVLFAVLLPSFGLIIALSTLVIVASLASPEFAWKGAIINTIVLNVFCIGVFVYGISLQFPVWPVWFR